jgi:hypothetical protein
MRTAIAIFLIFASSTALAGPWCLVRDENVGCNFQTAESCYNAVASQGGSCRENYKEVGTSGIAPFCVVTATYRRCIYGSRDSCVRRAMAVNGGCVRNIERDLELSARNKRVVSSSDCGDLACELSEVGSGQPVTPATEQIILDEPDF